MQELRNNDLKKIKAGGVSGWVVAGIIAGITFLVGVFDGFTRPFKCR